MGNAHLRRRLTAVLMADETHTKTETDRDGGTMKTRETTTKPR
jgi:hypothetical protein